MFVKKKKKIHEIKSCGTRERVSIKQSQNVAWRSRDERAKQKFIKFQVYQFVEIKPKAALLTQNEQRLGLMTLL